MANKSYSKKILALLSVKPAISVAELAEATGAQKYALTRSLKGLSEAGLVESHHSGQNDYARLTKEGKKKAHSLKLENNTTLLNPNWDGKWRIVLLDLPEERKSERDGLRYLLKKAGFILLKNSVWISPHPFEHLFRNIKKDLGLTTEMMTFVTSDLDEETEKEFLKNL
ncbi:MAG TPA: MarR family transcriptional regulator [Candidatus Paceibacterota bacterium]|nr:MarR family transcriptional regulator [Candidatus Paceibacterota bacterium]